MLKYEHIIYVLSVFHSFSHKIINHRTPNSGTAEEQLIRLKIFKVPIIKPTILNMIILKYFKENVNFGTKNKIYLHQYHNLVTKLPD